MKLSDFHYDLPAELIAQVPLAERSASRLLVLDRRSGQRTDADFVQLPDWLRPGDLLVFNDTKVLHARLFGVKDSGGQVELLIERVLDERRVLAQVRASKPLREGRKARLEGQVDVVMIARHGDLFELEFECDEPVIDVLERIGHLPLPPYIARGADQVDEGRYQTVHARHLGAVAAPTAGLHFDATLLSRLAAQGVHTATLTLHVGAGTFKPVRVENIEEHRMHREWLDLREDTVQKILATKQAGGRVIAVGTTVVRSLETAARDGELRAYRGDTDIFLYPGARFRVVDALITNFHLPGSTLLMLVSAFAGRDTVMNAYQHAIAQRYRFFSYGDAMLIL